MGQLARSATSSKVRKDLGSEGNNPRADLGPGGIRCGYQDVRFEAFQACPGDYDCAIVT